MTVALVLPCAARIVQGSIAILSLILLARAARADDPARVHIVLHPRGTAEAPITFVDISVRGIDAPIRLVRRIDGACTMAPEGLDPDALVAVACDAAATRFSVTRAHGEIVVTRSGTAPDAEPQVIARASLPASVTVRVDGP